jgi:hypothetical protein
MAQSLFQDPPQAQGNWQVNMSKMAVLIGQWRRGEIAPSTTSSSAGGMNIPPNDEMVFTYVASTNNVSTIVYKLNGSTVATQTFTYVNSGVADNDDIASIVLS